MAGDTGIYATTAQIQYKAGAKASAVSKAEAYTNVFIALAEGVINTMCQKVFAATQAAFTALPAGGKAILSDAASSLAAMYVINYDLSGFTSRVEAETMLDLLRDSFMRDINELKEVEKRDFVIAGT